MTSALANADADADADPKNDADLKNDAGSWTMSYTYTIKVPCKYSFYIMQVNMKTNNWLLS